MDDRSDRAPPSTDSSLRFALLFFVCWMVTAVLPRLAAPPELSLFDMVFLVPVLLAAFSLTAGQRARFWLQLLAIPTSLIFVSAVQVPLETPSSVPWTLMAAGALLSYWLWVLAHAGTKPKAALQTRPTYRARTLARPREIASARPWVLPVLSVLATGIILVLPPLFASSERRAFVLAMAAGFVVMAAIGGVVPMLRVERRRADRKEVRRRALIMFAYAAACLAVLWGYMEYRQI